MKSSLAIIAGLLAVTVIVGLAALNLSGSTGNQDNVLVGTEQLRVQQMEAKRAEREATGESYDFRTDRESITASDQGVRREGHRTVIPNTLPPDLNKLKNELDTINSEMAAALAEGAQQPDDHVAVDPLIAEMDALIAQTNADLGLDTSAIDKALAAPVKPTDPQLIELNQQMDALDAELDDWARSRAQSAGQTL